jgi:hypothetical protein
LRIRVAGLPGVTAERVDPKRDEIVREVIRLGDVVLGEIVYVRRSSPGGTDYGWRPATHARKLGTSREPNERLIDRIERRTG